MPDPDQEFKDVTPVKDPKGGKRPSRITHLTQLHHAGSERGVNPVSYDFRSSRPGKPTEEEPYARRIHLNEDWQQLDTGWVESAPSMVVLENLTGVGQHKVPSPEEVAAMAEQELHVSFNSHLNGGPMVACKVAPGDHFAFCPAHADSVQVRCAKGATKARIVILPHC